jgi:putative two-component system response regulator
MRKQQIMIVDDDPHVLDSLRRDLHGQVEEWDVTYVRHPETAWEDLLQNTYDAIVTDIRMPGVNGMDLLDRIRHTEKVKNVPVVMLTGFEEDDVKMKALNLGAVDLLKKPVDIDEFIARIRNVLQMKSYEDELRSTNELLSEKIRRQTIDLAQTRMSIVCRLGMAAEFRDEDTGNHVIRVGCFSRVVAAAMGLPRSFLEMLLLAAPLHDIGKIGIPDRVLLKPGPLDDEEWAIMQKHCEIGERILREQSNAVVPLFDWYAAEMYSTKDVEETRDPVLDMAASIALSHHEKWDGSGYPQKLTGEAIPIEARIVAIADVFDALTSNRPYRAARPEEEALSIIDGTVGTHFDPRVYQAFRKSLDEIRDIRTRFNDDVVVFPRPDGVKM